VRLTIARRVWVGDGLKGLVQPVGAHLRQSQDHLHTLTCRRRARKTPALYHESREGRKKERERMRVIRDGFLQFSFARSLPLLFLPRKGRGTAIATATVAARARIKLIRLILTRLMMEEGRGGRKVVT
jgi:fatty acid desaturase